MRKRLKLCFHASETADNIKCFIAKPLTRDNIRSGCSTDIPHGRSGRPFPHSRVNSRRGGQAAVIPQERDISIFGNILNKVFNHDPANAETNTASATQGSSFSAPAQLATAAAMPPPAAAASSNLPPASVYVAGVLREIAAMKSDHGGYYQSSIVDLLKLLDLEFDLSARKELAGELGVRAGADGSAEQNIALHRAVMNKLAINGGVVPESLHR